MDKVTYESKRGNQINTDIEFTSPDGQIIIRVREDEITIEACTLNNYCEEAKVPTDELFFMIRRTQLKP